MSGLAYHAQHFKSGSVGSLDRHNWLKRKEKDEHSNQDIDPGRSHLNFQPHPLDESLYVAAKRRIQEGCTGRVTAASNWITETIVYPPEDVVGRYKDGGDDAELRRYYADVLEWHKWEFGAANVLVATVHLDETTPHMHTDVVPMTDDGKLSSKEVFARKNLRRHHTELAAFLNDKGWDIQRGESTFGKQVRSKTVAEYKKDAEKAKNEILEEVAELKDTYASIKKEAAELGREASKQKERATQAKNLASHWESQVETARQNHLTVISDVRETELALQARREEMKALSSAAETQKSVVEGLRITKRNLSMEVAGERSALEKMRERVGEAAKELEGLEKRKTALQSEVEDLENEKENLTDQVSVLHEAASRINRTATKYMASEEWNRLVAERKEKADLKKQVDALQKENGQLKEFLAELGLLERFREWAAELAASIKEKLRKKKDGPQIGR